MSIKCWIVVAGNDERFYSGWWDNEYAANQTLKDAQREQPYRRWRVVRLVEAPAEPEPSAAVDVAELAKRVDALELRLFGDESADIEVRGGILLSHSRYIDQVKALVYDRKKEIESMGDWTTDRLRVLEERIEKRIAENLEKAGDIGKSDAAQFDELKKNILAKLNAPPQPAQPRMVRAAFDEPWAPALACVPEWVVNAWIDWDGIVYGAEFAPVMRTGVYPEDDRWGYDKPGGRFVRLGVVKASDYNIDWRLSLRKVIR